MSWSNSSVDNYSGSILEHKDQEFKNLINKAFSLNNNCVSLSSQLMNFQIVETTTTNRSSNQQQQQQQQGDDSETIEVEVTRVKKVSFKALSKSRSEKQFVLRVESEPKKLEWNALRTCFFRERERERFPSSSTSSSLNSPTQQQGEGKPTTTTTTTTTTTRSGWKNVLRTPVPVGVNFQDLSSELEVYQLLDSRNERGVEELRGVVFGLERVEQELRERLDQVKKELGIGERARKLMKDSLEKLHSINTTTTPTTSTTTPTTTPTSSTTRGPQTKTTTKTSSSNGTSSGEESRMEEVYFVVNEKEPFVRRVRIEFEMEISEQRAIDELETFEKLIDLYFQVSPIQARNLRESKVISSQDEKDLVLKWVKESRGKEVETTSLLFQGTRDGFGSTEFHKRCDNQGPTLVVFRTTGGKRGGGYSHVPWDSSGGFKGDAEKKSFLFSVDNQSKHVISGSDRAIYANSGYGPIFGGGNDLYLSSNCNVNSCSSNPSSYPLPSNSQLAGSNNFQVSEYEVWKIE